MPSVMSIHSGAHVRLPRPVCCGFSLHVRGRDDSASLGKKSSLHEALQRAGLLGCAEEGSTDRQGHRLDPSGAWRWRPAARFRSGFLDRTFEYFRM